MTTAPTESFRSTPTATARSLPARTESLTTTAASWSQLTLELASMCQRVQSPTATALICILKFATASQTSQMEKVNLNPETQFIHLRQQQKQIV